ncbi:FABP family protein [Corynebacterium sp. NPDC060344]|uniref:FABP family protein n=1 Tax=Corynebacterium sp. NPDC060344 TaxID=3347101 RepID=UPI003653A8D3
MNLHPLVAEFEFLIGTWKGPGRGHYPTIDSFRYTETLTFGAVPGKPFLRYEQKTAGAEGQPMHTECGFLRPLGDGRVELVLAQPTGQTELLEGMATPGHEGDPEALTMTFDRSVVANSASAKQVDATARRWVLNAGRTEMATEFGMAAVGEPMQQHLVSELAKQ